MYEFRDYILGLNSEMDAMTIGATTPEQVDENLALMARYPVA